MDASEHWDSRYNERERIWSGEPNRALVAEAADLLPGRALDLGCGEGADSVWLAEQRWLVTAVDVSATAVARGTALAKERSISDERIRWIVEDLETWRPRGTYALVSACFLHSRIAFDRTAVLRRAANAVEPGGHLLIVGHAEAPPWAGAHAGEAPAFLGPDEELATLRLDDAHWDVVTNEVRGRETTGPQGETATLRDSVLLLRRD